ncbi:MAG: excisionase [Eubacterium sp.]
MKKQESSKRNNSCMGKIYKATITEASNYYHIGENKLRMIAEEHIKEDFIIMNGNRVLFKRQKFEKFLDNATVV